ncbi:transposase [Streptomyces sp. NPDC054833]
MTDQATRSQAKADPSTLTLEFRHVHRLIEPVAEGVQTDAEQLSRRLREHPGVEIACRDGSLTYRQGIADGAPEAVQVSDRFHLWQGLSRRVQEVAAAHRGCLPEALPALDLTGPELADTAATESESAYTPASRHARRLFESVHALTDAGRSYSSAARELGLDRRTVRKYARARTWHEVVRRPPRRPSALDPYLNYLQQRWDEGEHSAKILHQELLAKSSSPRATWATISA